MIVSSIHYTPSARPSDPLIHICKTGCEERIWKLMTTKQTVNRTALSYGWDDGTGKCIRALKPAFAGTRVVYAFHDLTDYGLESLHQLLKLLRETSTKCVVMGIADPWLPLIPDSYTIAMTVAERKRVKAIARKDPALFALIGPESRSLLDSGRKAELEAFMHAPQQRGLAKVLRDRLAR